MQETIRASRFAPGARYWLRQKSKGFLFLSKRRKRCTTERMESDRRPLSFAEGLAYFFLLGCYWYTSWLQEPCSLPFEWINPPFKSISIILRIDDPREPSSFFTAGNLFNGHSPEPHCQRWGRGNLGPRMEFAQDRSVDQSNPSSSALCHHLSHLPELTIYHEPPGFKSAVKEKLGAGRLWETDSSDLSQAMGFHHANRKIQ